ncbi:Fc.00g112700.m01.CDS01 [Cosmosporella sp. VM-42]
MSTSLFSFRLLRFRRALFITLALIFVASIWHFSEVLRLTWPIVSLPLKWHTNESEWLISEENDGFDLTFANYSIHQTTAGEGYEDKVPAVLHHIMLGTGKPKDHWNEARQSCMDFYPGWEFMLWTDEMAQKLVAEKFPDFKATWDGYQLPIQRVDTLRYMILYEYGGIILDMDIQCKRALGPLRRFEFVAPAAFPTGFSVSFLMSSKHNEFIKALVDKWLKLYDRNWFWTPYATVMFSTGGHFASQIHVMWPKRADLKILAGPKDNPKLHSINGPVSTPLFNHLGSSSWHSYDGLFITSIGKYGKWIGLGAVVGLVGILLYTMRSSRRRRGRSPTRESMDDLEKRLS